MIAKKNNALLIFDEITSGFKDNYGGLHLKLKVNPDMAIFGKSIGNGYPIAAITGKRDIMNTFEKRKKSTRNGTSAISPPTNHFRF